MKGLDTENDSPSGQASSGLPVYFAKTLAGMEYLLRAELIEQGAQDLVTVLRGVEFGADMATLIRICLTSRFSIRVLRPVLTFKAEDPDELHREAVRWDWGSVMDHRATFAIDATIHSEHFTHSQYATLRLKDAIADHFREITGNRPSVNRENPDVRIHLHISNEK